MNENDNKMWIDILVSAKEREEIYPDNGGKKEESHGIAWTKSSFVIYEDKPGQAFSSIDTFLGYGTAFVITWLEGSKMFRYNKKVEIHFDGYYKGNFFADVEFLLPPFPPIPTGFTRLEYEFNYYIIDQTNGKLITEKKFEYGYFVGVAPGIIDREIDESEEITLSPAIYTYGVKLVIKGVSGGLAFCAIDLWDKSKGYGWSLGPISIIGG